MLVNPERWAFLEPEAFKQQLLESYETGEIWVVHIYNLLVPEAVKSPEKIAQLAEVAADVFASLGETDSELLFLELYVRCLMTHNDLDQALVIIKRIISLDISYAESTAIELAEELVENADAFGVSLDQRPSVLKLAEDVFRHYGKTELIFELYIQSAYLYSGHGASQAAYRYIFHAEKIAIELGSIHLRARCYSLYNVIAFEMSDLQSAILMGEQALTLYQEAEVGAPADLLSNLGVAYLNLDELSKAEDYFNRALNSFDNTNEMKASINLNLSICFRRRNLLTEAEAALASAEANANDRINPESALELTLGAAKLAVTKADLKSLIEHLQVASGQLDRMLSYILRLHHRRGVREKYITRIEGLLRSLPASGKFSDALFPIVSTRGNAMADWLETLTWAEETLKSPLLSSELAEQLDVVLHRIRKIGAPHLFGIIENFDDSWGVINEAGVWDDFSQLANRINAVGLPKPLSLESSSKHAGLCRTRLSQGHCLMFTTYAGDGALLWCFIGERYSRIEIPLQPLVKWHKAQLDYANYSIERFTFVAALDELTNALSTIIDPIFEDIADSECISVCYIDDALRDIPLMLFALRNLVIADRMKKGEFEVRLVPAMIEQVTDNKNLSLVTAVVDFSEDLPLAPFEAQTFANVIGGELSSTISAQSHENLTPLTASQVLVVSTHGQSLSFFTDAYFAKLGSLDKHHVINVATLQEIAPDLPILLVILNTCYSGSKIARNYYKTFRTSDAVSIPNLFLLNRKATALAGAWKLSDTAGYILTYLVGDGLKRGYFVASAIASAIARLPEMTRSDVIAILEENLPRSVYEEKVSKLMSAPEHGMFSNSYFSAGLIVHGLL